MSDDGAVRRIRAHFGMGYRLILFGGTFVIFSLLYAVLDTPFSDVISTADAHSTTNASSTGISYISQAWTWAPFWAAVLGLMMILIGAVVESGGFR